MHAYAWDRWTSPPRTPSCQLGSRAPSQRAAANRATTVVDCRGGCCESGRQAGRGGGPAAARWGCCAFGRRCPSIVRARGSIKKSQLGPGGGGEDKRGRGRLNQPCSTTRALFKRFYGNKNPDDDWPAFRKTGFYKLSQQRFCSCCFYSLASALVYTAAMRGHRLASGTSGL